jgi:hypothetical protein
MFALCADGIGLSRIAKILNNDGASSPKAQQGRPSGWAPSSVREVVQRELDRGQIVWNQTRKRDRWGRKQQAPRPSTEWMRIAAPELQIVSEELWAAAHAMRGMVREKYLRANGNKRWGRSPGEESKYLLTGLARCGCCRGGLYVRSRSHGKRRAFFYGCTSFHRKGRAVCKNGQEVPMKPFDAAVLSALQRFVLSPSVIEAVVARVIHLLNDPLPNAPNDAAEKELPRVEAEIRRLSNGIAIGGQLSGLLEALRDREQRKRELEEVLAKSQVLRSPTRLDHKEIRRRVERALADWKGLLDTHVTNGRNILRRLLDGPIICTPTVGKKSRGYEFRAQVNLGPMVAGILKLGDSMAGAMSFLRDR